MAKILIFSFIFIIFFVKFGYGDFETPDFHNYMDISSPKSKGCEPIFGSCSEGYEGYRYQQPIYGNAGYTTGQINTMYNVNTGSNSGNYNGYTNNYWICVNQYRGQYYYSYTYGKYICDARANRYG